MPLRLTPVKSSSPMLEFLPDNRGESLARIRILRKETLLALREFVDCLDISDDDLFRYKDAVITNVGLNKPRAFRKDEAVLSELTHRFGESVSTRDLAGL